jgi:hypothetical protein
MIFELALVVATSQRLSANKVALVQPSLLLTDTDILVHGNAFFALF